MSFSSIMSASAYGAFAPSSCEPGKEINAAFVEHANVRFISYTRAALAAYGVLTPAGDAVVELSAAGFALDLEAFVILGAAGLAQLRDWLAVEMRAAIPLAEVTIVAPFPQPTRTILCVGKNYRDHAAEFHGSGFDAAGGTAIPDAPIIFVKHPSSVVGAEAPIVSGNDPTATVDYEGELGVVIGAPAFRVAKRDAFNYVYGYTIVNDVTSRELQSKHKQWFIGKSVDSFCPMGPYLVTADEIADVTTLRLQTFVNEELRQTAVVADLIFDIPTLIETLTATTTLLPGDIIATGTPAGVGIGFTPPKYLAPGDRVRITIDGLGALCNPVT
jgi:2-keto-4-pentenoate hydratase/2-oxohepta-3-ene-1,7-dioic acid hydratase in catechol pathway